MGQKFNQLCEDLWKLARDESKRAQFEMELSTYISNAMFAAREDGVTRERMRVALNEYHAQKNIGV